MKCTQKRLYYFETTKKVVIKNSKQQHSLKKNHLTLFLFKLKMKVFIFLFLCFLSFPGFGKAAFDEDFAKKMINFVAATFISPIFKYGYDKETAAKCFIKVRRETFTYSRGVAYYGVGSGGPTPYSAPRDPAISLPEPKLVSILDSLVGSEQA